MAAIIRIGTGAGKRHMPWLTPAALLKGLTQTRLRHEQAALHRVPRQQLITRRPEPDD